MSNDDLQFPGAHVLPAMKKCKECDEYYKYYQTSFINYGGRGLNLEGLCDKCINNKVLEGQEREKILRQKLRQLHIDNRDMIKKAVDDQYGKTQKNNEFSEF